MGFPPRFPCDFLRGCRLVPMHLPSDFEGVVCASSAQFRAWFPIDFPLACGFSRNPYINFFAFSIWLSTQIPNSHALCGFMRFNFARGLRCGFRGGPCASFPSSLLLSPNFSLCPIRLFFRRDVLFVRLSFLWSLIQSANSARFHMRFSRDFACRFHARSRWNSPYNFHAVSPRLPVNSCAHF